MYKVGLVGAGRGVGVARFFEIMPDCKLAAVCDLSQEKLERVAEGRPGLKLFTDYEAMLSDGVDIVVVATPMPLHAEQTILALKAGCHVLQEVTLSDTVEGCRAIFDAVKAHPKQKFMLGENCCYWGYVLEWERMWQQGLLGEFMYAEAEYVHNIRSLLRNPDGTPAWRAFRPPVVYCTHSLGPLLKVTGERITSVCCIGSGNKLVTDVKNPDFMVAICQTANGGAIKLLRAHAVAREPGYHYYTIYGTKGCVESSRPPQAGEHSLAFLESIPRLPNMITLPFGHSERVPAEARALGGHGSIEYLMVSDFMRAIRSDAPSPIDIHAAVEMTLPGLCAHESYLKGGQPVPVPNWREG
ncbi:MAG: Gfo/Idh/MocA family oxidoreductase [Armatimonadetes bacterium]|nr:Gfo/Idh/MocA family oxidoreductase [Armatimonadota bacterium]